MMPCAFQASSILRYSVILFWCFFAAVRLSGLMFSNPMKTRVTPARFAFSTKFSILWHSVSTWIIRPRGNSVLFPQLDQAIEDCLPLFVASRKLSSVMKNLWMPCAQLRRTSSSTSSAERKRDLRPCTLMIVQNEH